MKQKNQKGFSYIELLVVLGLITLAGLLTTTSVGSFFSLRDNSTTEVAVRDLSATLKAMYEDNAWTIDSVNETYPSDTTAANQPLLFRNRRGDNSLRTFQGNSKANPGDCRSNPDVGVNSTNQILQLDQYLPKRFLTRKTIDETEQAEILVDGYGRNICVFVLNYRVLANSNSLERYRFHEIVVASPGKDGILNTNFNVPTLEALVVQGDDVVESFSGLTIHRERLALIKRNLRNVADKYEAYFSARYLANPNRIISTNYFANCPNFDDPSNPVGCSNPAASPGSTNTSFTASEFLVRTSAAPAIDAALNELVSPYPDAPIGQCRKEFCMFNANERVANNSFGQVVEIRSPLTLGVREPPYTAVIYLNVLNTPYTETATGKSFCVTTQC